MNPELQAVLSLIMDATRTSTSTAEEVLDQICYLTYLRALDEERDDASGAPNKELTGKVSMFLKQAGRYRWKQWASLSPASSLLEVLRSEVFPYMASLHERPEVGDFFKDAELRSWDSKTVAVLVLAVDALFLNSNSAAERGDAFDSLIEAFKDFGRFKASFRTPSEVRSIMIHIADPKFGQRICDPACGTGGLLVEALKQMIRNRASASIKAAVEEQGKSSSLAFEEMVFGFDISRFMVRIATVSLVIRGIRTPAISRVDSLNQLDPDALTKFDSVLLDPPFGLTVSKERKLELGAASRGDQLFVNLAIKLLKPGGLCVMLTPNNVLFGSGRSQRSYRERLVNDNHLIGVIGLPEGVLLPNTSIACSLLVFRKAETMEPAATWFFSLSGASQVGARASRQRIDLRSVSELTAAWDEYAASEFTKPPGIESNRIQAEGSGLEWGWWARRTTIAEHDYHLSPVHYKPRVKFVNSSRPPVELFDEAQSIAKVIDHGLKDLESSLIAMIVSERSINDNYPLVAFKDIAQIITPKRIDREGDVEGLPVLRIGNVTGSNPIFVRYNGPIDASQRVRSGDILVAVDGTIGAYMWNGEDALLGPSVYKIVSDDNRIRRRFLFHALRFLGDELRDQARGNPIKHISREQIENLKIPLPALEVQKNIVGTIEEVQRLNELFQSGSRASQALETAIIANAFVGTALRR